MHCLCTCWDGVGPFDRFAIVGLDFDTPFPINDPIEEPQELFFM